MPVPDPFREGMARGWKTRDGSQLDSDLTLEADVVIVGERCRRRDDGRDS